MRSRAQTIAIILSRFRKKQAKRGARFESATQSGAQRAEITPGLPNPMDASILTNPDMNVDANANRIVAKNLKDMLAHETKTTAAYLTRETFDLKVQEEAAALRDTPLLHFTSAEAAIDMLKNGLKTTHDMEGQFAEIKEEIQLLKHNIKQLNTLAELYKDDDRLRLQGDSLPEVLPAMRAQRAKGQKKIDAIKDELSYLDDIDSEVTVYKEQRKMQAESIRLEDTAMGATQAPDIAAGLDQFVFAFHGVAGKTYYQYGDVGVVLSPDAFYKTPGAFATPKDIAGYANDPGDNYTPSGFVTGFQGAVQMGSFEPATIKEYQDNVVTGDGYSKAAAAGHVTGNMPRGEWELKIPSTVNKKHVIGLTTTSLESYDKLIAAGVPEDKIKYIEEFDYKDALTKHVRHLQKTGGWFRGEGGDQYELPPSV